MEKIVYVALDERPCNEKFPREIFQNENLKIVSPSLDCMPYKRKPANFDALKSFLLKETKDAFGLVISMDTLLYGGLVPSRIHDFDDSEINERMEFLKELKETNKNLIIYGFQVILRSPCNNGVDEEPFYYKTEGRQIYLNGHYTHKEKLGILTETDIEEWKKLNITKEYLDNYVGRRKQNLGFELMSIKYAKEDIFDFLIFCQDDAGEFCYSAMDQEVIAKAIKDNDVRMKVYAYSGADELGVVLITRMVNKIKGKQPTFYIKYPSVTTPSGVPCVEDRYLDTTVKYQIISSGGIVVPSLLDADIVLVALMGATKQFPTVMEDQRDVDVLTNLPETFEFIKWIIGKKPVIVADLLFLNAGSVGILNYIKESNILEELAAYSGWNTSSNALGTAVAQGTQFFYTGKTKQHTKFLIKRYVEDIGYQCVVRTAVRTVINNYGLDYFDVKEVKGLGAKLIEEGLLKFIEEHLKPIKEKFILRNVNLPWKRKFEVDFDIELSE